MKKALLLFLTPISCCALQEQPWLDQLLEFHFVPSYNYSIFSEVDRGVPPLDGNFSTHVLAGNLFVTAPETWQFQTELEVADTTSVSWGYRSFALEVRKQWFDDICGDFLSVTTGLTYRDASTRMRKALSTPYHARANFELNCSIGKEWSLGPYWVFRTFGFIGIGQGTEGYPWLIGNLYLWWNVCNQHQFRLYSQTYWGLGDRKTVPTIAFPGWSKINHQSIDLGIGYRYHAGMYGFLRLDYLLSIYAKSYPEWVNSFMISWDFPFSVL